ncbi:MAG: hypothetical protein ACPGVU_20375 [Limisphaerales bacterium]
MRNAIVVGIVLLVTGINTWMSWAMWRDQRRPPSPLLEPEAARKSPTPAIRPNRIFRPERKTTETAARPPWLSIESDDYHQYAANLRAIGCPENTIRDIIVADVGENFKKQKQALEDRTADPFWLTADQREEIDLERKRQVRELKLAKWELMRELFGYPVDEEVMQLVRTEGMGQLSIWMLGGFLEREKLVPLIGLVGYHGTRAEAIDEQAYGILTEEDYAQARDLRDRMEKEVTTLVGSAAVEELYLRRLLAQGGEAGALQYGLNLSGTEFRNLMKIKSSPVDVFTMLFSEIGFEDMVAEKVSDEQIETAIASYLGTERFADYTRAKDDRYQGIFTFATEHGLAKKEAIAVFKARDRAETELKRMDADGTLSAEEQVLLQAAIKTRLESEIRKHFGPNIAREYQADGAGEWVEELINTPNPFEDKR